MVDELIEVAARPLAKLVYLLARSLLWLGWDMLVQTVGWSIGWCIFRVVTLGNYPEERLTEVDDAHWVTALFVELTGLAFLGAVIVALQSLFGF